MTDANHDLESQSGSLSSWGSGDRWEIDRYVLGDDSFDRDAFEARMAEDDQLALAVADTVEELDQLSVGCRNRRREESAIRPSSVHKVQDHLPAAAVLTLVVAACLLIALGVYVSKSSDQESRPRLLAGRVPAAATPGATVPAVPFSVVAERWLVMPAASESDDGLLVTTFWEEEVESSTDYQSAEWPADDDWLVKAAQEFYQELEG